MSQDPWPDITVTLHSRKPYFNSRFSGLEHLGEAQGGSLLMFL